MKLDLHFDSKQRLTIELIETKHYRTDDIYRVSWVLGDGTVKGVEMPASQIAATILTAFEEIRGAT